MQILNEKNLNLNKPFQSDPFTLTAANQALVEAYCANIDNESDKRVVLVFAYDDGTQTHQKVFTGVIKDGITLNYKLNEELDSINIELIDSEELSSTNVVDFKIPNKSRCRVYYEATPTQNIQYAKYDEFVVANGNFVARKTPNGYVYYHGYNLVEPIYLTRFIAVDTNTFTNLPEITVYDSDLTPHTYTQDETNALACLNRILAITNVGSYDSVSMYEQIEIDSDTEALLESSGVGWNYFYNATSLYDVLFKIFKIVNCYPRLSFSGKIFKLKAEKMSSTGISHNLDITSCDKFVVSDLAEKQASQIVCYAQNVTTNVGMKYPHNEDIGETIKYAVGQVMDFANIIGKPKEEVAQWTFFVPSPIYKGNKVYIKYEWEATEIASPHTRFELDETRSYNLVNKKEWDILDANVQNVTAYFEQGSKEVHVTHILINLWSTTEMHSVFYADKVAVTRVTASYYPFANPKLVFGKHNGWNEVVAQEDSAVDGVEFGKFLEQYAKQNSGLNFQFGKIATAYTGIYKAGDTLNTDYGKLVVNDVQITIKNNIYECQYNANYEQVIRSDEIGYDSTIENKFIDPTLLQERKFTFFEDMNLHLDSTHGTSGNNQYIVDTELCTIIQSCFWQIITSGNFGKLKYIAQLTYKNADESFSTTFYRPTSVSIVGNSIMLEIDSDELSYNYANGISDLTINGVTTAQKISDVFGKVDTLTLKLKHGYGSDPTYTGYVTFAEVDEFQILKDTNEKLSIAFQLGVHCDLNDTLELLKILTESTDSNYTYRLAIFQSDYDIASYGARRIVSACTKNGAYMTFTTSTNLTPNYKYNHLVLDYMYNNTLVKEKVLVSGLNDLESTSNVLNLWWEVNK